MAELQLRQGQRMKAVLAQYYALYQEPNSGRSAPQYKFLNELLMKGVSKEGPQKINISVNPGNKNDPYSSTEMMMGIMASSIYLEKNADKNELELFTELTSLFIAVFDKDKLPKDLFTELYLESLQQIKSGELLAAYCAYISKTSYPELVSKWEAENETKLEQFTTWRNK